MKIENPQMSVLLPILISDSPADFFLCFIIHSPFSGFFFHFSTLQPPFYKQKPPLDPKDCEQKVEWMELNWIDAQAKVSTFFPSVLSLVEIPSSVIGKKFNPSNEVEKKGREKNNAKKVFTALHINHSSPVFNVLHNLSTFLDPR